MTEFIERNTGSEVIVAPVSPPPTPKNILRKMVSILVRKYPLRFDLLCLTAYLLRGEFLPGQSAKPNLSASTFIFPVGYFALVVDRTLDGKPIAANVSPFNAEEFAGTHTDQNCKTVGMNKRVFNFFAIVGTQIRLEKSCEVVRRKDSFIGTFGPCRDCKSLYK